MRGLQAMNVTFFGVTNLTSNVTWPTGSFLLPLADGSHMPVQDCICWYFAVFLNKLY